MDVSTLFANVSCSDLDASIAWYEALLATPPHRRPMTGLAEWQFSESAALQLYETREHAGHSTLTIGVANLDQERARLLAAGLTPNDIEEADYVRIMRMSDPDQNLVVLTGAKSA